MRFHLVQLRQSLTKVRTRTKRGLTVLNIKDRHVSQAKAPTMEKKYNGCCLDFCYCQNVTYVIWITDWK